MLIELLIDCAAVKLNIGVLFGDELDALGSSNKDHELDVVAAALLHFGDRRVGRAAGGEHGVDDHDIALGDVLRHLAEVDVRLKRFLVAEHTDVADTGRRNHAQNAVDQSKTGAQNGHDCNFLTGQRRLLRRADRRFDRLGGERQITGGLIGDEHPDLADQLPEILDAGVFIAHDRQLVRDERMIHDVYVFSKCFRAHDVAPLSFLFNYFFK